MEIFASEIAQYLSAKCTEMTKDLIFNCLRVFYLSLYRRIGGWGTLKNFFEKCTQSEVVLSFFGLSVSFLFVKWEACEVVPLISEREVIVNFCL